MLMVLQRKPESAAVEKPAATTNPAPASVAAKILTDAELAQDDAWHMVISRRCRSVNHYD